MDFLTSLQRAFLFTDLHGLPHTTPTSLLPTDRHGLPHTTPTSLSHYRSTRTSSHHSNEPFSLQIYTDFLTPLQRAFLPTYLHGLAHTTPTSLSPNISTRTSSHHSNEPFSQHIYTDFLPPFQRAFLPTYLHGLPHTIPTSLSPTDLHGFSPCAATWVSPKRPTGTFSHANQTDIFRTIVIWTLPDSVLIHRGLAFVISIRPGLSLNHSE